MCLRNEERPESSPSNKKTTGHLVLRVIVVDFDVDVNGYAAFGEDPPFYRAPSCLACGEVGSLVGHGKRRRGVWLVGLAAAVEIWVRRLRCNIAACKKTCTVLPSFLHPLHRYALPLIEQVVVACCGEGLSFLDLEKRFAEPAASTQRAWVGGFIEASENWCDTLLEWLSLRSYTMTLPRDIERDESARGLLGVAQQSADWLAEMAQWPKPDGGRLLECLWLWGCLRVKHRLIVTTRCRAGPQRGPSPNVPLDG